MITKNQIKYFASLQKKKHRDSEKLFLVEGVRSVEEILKGGFTVRMLLVNTEVPSYRPINPSLGAEIVYCTSADLKKISVQQTVPPIIAVVQIPDLGKLPLPKDKLVLALDTVQDPGNLGTIIRTADWFGIKHIVCSKETADAFSPKVVQSTMGALGNISVYYTDLATYIQSVKEAGLPVYGTLLSGTDFYAEELSQEGLIVLGNEGNGISPAIAQLVDKKLFIPPFPQGSDNVESLNVGIAAAIVCAEFRRRAIL